MLCLNKLPKNGAINTLCSVMSPVGSPIPRPGGQFQVLRAGLEGEKWEYALAISVREMNEG